MKDDIVKKHESYGMVSVSKCQSTATPLFGSSILHSHYMSLKISHADEHRSLNRSWYIPKDLLIEIELSPSQFYEAITNTNTSGVPCTIRYIQGHDRIEQPPFENKVQEHQDEFKEMLKESNEAMLKTIKVVEDIIANKKTLNKKDKEEILFNLTKAQRSISSSAEFQYSQFNKQMDKTIREAKGEVESFIENKIRQTGLEALKSEMPMLESSNEKEVL